MVFPSLASLKDLCCIHFAYLQWIRTNVANNDIVQDLNSLEELVSAAAQNLPLPEELKSLVVKHVKPTGGRLLSLFKLWLSKLPSDTPQKQLIGEMLFDCLILNADGQINQRRTAQTLLSNKVLHNVLAFRLACINFLEIEVLKLWILVREHFLNKIVLEGYRSDLFVSARERAENTLDNYYIRTSEPDEVSFWIGHCLSRENAVDIREVPHFMGSEVDWYDFALDSAVASGNVACFDYFKNFSGGTIEYEYVDRIKIILRSAEENSQHSSFIFHFMLLNFEEKSDLFREFPREMVNQFLQWPLSQTFLQHTEEVWNFLPDEDKHWVFSEVYNALIFEKVVFRRGHIPHLFQSSPSYCEEHLLGIWHALWNLSPDNFKLAFLDLRIFPNFPDLHGNEFFIRFEESSLKQKLLSLFLSNGQALLELYQGETLQGTLRNVVAKYLLADLQDLERRYISLFETFMMPLRLFGWYRERFEILGHRGTRVSGRYLDYIKTVLFSSDRNKQTICRD